MRRFYIFLIFCFLFFSANLLLAHVNGQFEWKTVVRSERSFKTTADLIDEPYSPTQDRTRFWISDSQKRWKAGAFFLGDTFIKAQSLLDSSTLTVREIRQYQFQKGYLGYEGSTWLRQVYLGNYRIGFFERTSQGMPLGFFPDEREILPGRINLESNFKKAVPLRGAAIQGGNEWFQYSGFYSKDSYPTPFQIQTQDSTSGNISITSRTVQDLLDMQLIGHIFNYGPNPDFGIGAFWIQHYSNIQVFDLNQEKINTHLWGLFHRGIFQEFYYHSVFSGADSKEGYFYFLKVQRTLANMNIRLSYKQIDPGYYNPGGSLFAGKYFQIFSVKILKDVSPQITLLMDYNQGTQRTRGVSFATRKLGFKLRWKTSEKTQVEFQQSYQDPYQFTLSESLSPYSSDKLQGGILLVYEPAKGVLNQLDFQIARKKDHQDQHVRLSQGIGYKLTFPWSSHLQSRLGIRMYDTDLHTPNTETQSGFIEFKYQFLKQFQCLLRWKNKFRLKQQTIVNEDGFRQEINNPGFQNTVTFQLVYSW